MTRGAASLSRRHLLGTCALGALGLGLPRLARAAGDRLLLVYWAQGGWDPTYCFDPHFESSTLARDPTSEPATLGGISFADAPSRPSVRSFFEAYGSRTVVVNGLAVGSISHAQCARLVLTGSRRPEAPDLGTRVAAGASTAYALPHLVVSGPRFPGSLGQHSIPLNTLLTGTVRGELPRGATVDADREARVRAFLAAEAAALPASAPADTFQAALSRYDTLEARADRIHVMEFAPEEDLLEAGINALGEGLSRVVTLGGGLPLMSQWDSHTNNHFYQDQNYRYLFEDLAELMARLEATPAPGGGGESLADVTTLLVLSEMGRTPVLNGSSGKDHWPYTSCMLVGRDLAGGQVVGASDGTLVGQPVSLSTGAASSSGAVLTPAALAAGLLQHLDVDPAEAFPGTDPFTAPFS